MRKRSISLDEIQPAPRSRRLPGLVVAIALAALSAPILYEAGAVCVANWRAVMGESTNVRTPVLDASVYFLERLRNELAGLILPWFQHVPWQPSHVLLVAGIAMMASMLMLRR